MLFGTVTAVRLGHVQRLVCHGGELLRFREFARGQGGHTDTQGDTVGDVGLRVRYITIPDRLAQALGDDQRILRRHRRQDDGKFLASVTGHQVTSSFAHGLHDCRHLLQAPVSGHVAVGVVVELEMIDIA